MLFSARLLALLSLSSIAVSLPAVSNDLSTQSPAQVLSGLNLSFPGPIPTSNAAFTCQVLSKLFSDNETFSSSSPFYTPLFEIPWSETCWLEPACIVTPRNEKDVSLIMIVISILQTKFAVRSGGHLVAPGYNGVGSDGVLIALQNLNRLAMSADTKTLTVGPGQRWGPVYNFASTYNVTVLGGREPTVGVGGLLLLGGLSLFYNTYGTSMSRISRYGVVLPNGRILNATSTENSDLFHALKGGITNFGIVTEFDLDTIPNSNNIYFEIYLYTPENTPAVLSAFANWTSNPNTDIKSNIEIRVQNTQTLAFLGYSEPTFRPAVFNEFYKIPVLSTESGPTNGTLLDVVASPAANAPNPGNTISKPFVHTIPNDKFLLEQYQLYLNLSANLPPNMLYSFDPQAVLPNLVTQSNAHYGGNLFNLEPVPQMWINIVMDYLSPENTTLATSKVDDFVNTAKASAQKQGLLLPFLLGNDAGVGDEVLRGYGPGSFAYIESIAAKLTTWLIFAINSMKRVRPDRLRTQALELWDVLVRGSLVERNGFSLTNNGPLTTTFTAPASCSTAYETMLGVATDPSLIQWGAQCEWQPPADCNPSGSVIQSIDSSAEGGNPTAGMIIVYHSPGLVCPYGWATVGAAAKPNPTSTSISGAFNQSDAILGSSLGFFEPELDVFLAALDPGETAVACCPSSYTTIGGACYSTLPSSVFTPTGGCEHILPDGDVGTVYGTWTIGGQTITGGLETITATSPLSTVTTSFAPSDATSYIGVAVNDMFILVHQASDTAMASTASSTSKTNSAVRVRGNENGLGVVATPASRISYLQSKMQNENPDHAMQPYIGLDITKKDIRLLRLLPAPHMDNEIYVALTTASLNDAGLKYEALSYTWGPSTEQYSIRLNSQAGHPVTDNLYYALRRIRHRQAERIL
ncbi:hypothetical protein G7Y89_g1531 [Cudoniella acicularis]|uniref:FAD-binding PCMH-type domain-containing protein n=1 Tax=Cudoniella acicularis TaxID=354080 RepID=A0A8H4W6X2_9HELO|nr:hypothetical protein G7Y89_g1531 [Cudoniella acicularis]